MSNSQILHQNKFLVTKEYLKFAEFCDACRKYKYIGLCYGPPGVGKTLSARYYAQWDATDEVFQSSKYNMNYIIISAQALEASRAVYYSVPVTSSPARIEREIYKVREYVGLICHEAKKKTQDEKYTYDPLHTQLLLIDEAERLKPQSLDQIRDIYDKSETGVVLIGMPGIEKRLSRYPQFYSRVGFLHNFKTISNTEMEEVLKYKWESLNMEYDSADPNVKEVIADIVRITRCNFRLIDKLFSQIERVLEINDLHQISREVVEVARESLIIGAD